VLEASRNLANFSARLGTFGLVRCITEISLLSMPSVGSTPLKPIDDPSPPAESTPHERLAPTTVASLFVAHADELRRFLIGMLGNVEAANDVLQITFAKAIEKGHTAQNESLRAWLFRVACNEAILIKRKQAIAQRANDELGRRDDRSIPTAEMNLVRWETVVGVRQAIEQLPPEQRQVLRMRIYEKRMFKEIAAELKLPLGTVLTRMQAAMAKLKKALDHEK
jgi:RNA polymerase sigma factor (sigma-70 family)